MSTVTIYPNKITIVPTIDRSKSNKSHYEKLLSFAAGELTKSSGKSLENLKKSKVRCNLSSNAKKRFFKACNWLYHLSPARTVKMKNGKYLYNFRTSFITLTLPSPQVHSDKEIKSKCLNHLFVVLKRKYNVNNYIWKAELQRNGNIHFHIITDTYIDYQALRRIWNNIIDKLDYVQKYREKMSSLPIRQYAELRQKSINEIKDAYVQGVRSNWSNPNSVDVRKIRSQRDLAVYLSKYMSKDNFISRQSKSSGEEKTVISIQELIRIKHFGNLWYCSTSLSRLKSSVQYDYPDISRWLGMFKKTTKDYVEKVYDYCRVIYYKLAKTSHYIRKELTEIFREYAEMHGYIVPG